VQFRVLGPFEADDERESLALGPRKQRALLVRLLLDAGRTVSVERLLDDLWGDDLPGTAVKMVQIYVSGLRKVVGTGRLLTQPSGYRLELRPDDQLDLHGFKRLAGAGSAGAGRSRDGRRPARRGARSVAWASAQRIRIRAVRTRRG
jgi:DNA-binding SARP family transcriptional activator